jgi:phytoene dehydrogenase-like protein
MESYVVAGGGLAGLTAANALADLGHGVTVLEQSERLGGRAHTVKDRGYFLNLGPHALYCGSYAAKVFGQWGIPFTGRPPEVKGRAWLVREGRKYPLIDGVGGLLTSRLFSPGEKLEAGRWLRFMTSFMTSRRASAEGSVDAWLSARVRSGRVRDFLAALIRVGTYTADLAHLGAGPALVQMRAALTGGVMYLDHGWQTLVNGLAERARSRGVVIHCGRQLGKLNELSGSGVVLAVPPAAVERITGARLAPVRPVRAACLDLGLRRLPAGSAAFALGVDRPLYLSVHSQAAKLAPPGAALVHVAKYLSEETGDTTASRAELEQFADLAIPGWREEVDLVRFLPGMTVVQGIAGPEGRPDVDAPGIDGVTVAGDWIGPEGMLADAAIASGLRAAEAVQRKRSRAA